MAALSPDLLSILIVPKSSSSAFGSLFEIRGQRDEIFISSATVNDVSVIDTITAAQLNASGNIVNSAATNIAIESVSAGTSSSTTLNTTTNTTTNTSTSTATSSSSSSGSGYSY